MLSHETFQIEHIQSLQKSSKADPALIERVMYAFGLLEALVRSGLPFVFKGGTCLMLLLENPMRLSTDIDIVVSPDTDIDAYLEKAAMIFPFQESAEHKRNGKNGIVKRHFRFFYDSPIRKARFHIILDVLFEENNYAAIIEREIKNDLLCVMEEPKLFVKVPTPEGILGDKLTAFAPHTTGILLQTDKSLEIVKQLYDIATLTDVIEDFQQVKDTYRKTVQKEIAYRGIDVTEKEVLLDTILSAFSIINKGKNTKADYQEYVAGARSLSHHVFAQKYSAELAALQSCKVACLAACVLGEKSAMISIDTTKEYDKEQITSSKYRGLNYMRKIDLQAYGYLVETVKILEELDGVNANV